MVNAKKHLGQNFLTDISVIDKIIAAAELSPNDRVIEIGPGRGILTQAIFEHTQNLTAIELDEDLIPNLKSRFPKLNLIHGDALQFQPPNTPYKLVANIPYYITSPILNHYLQNQNPPSLLVLMVQKEVAEKILAMPNSKGERKHSVLSLQVHIFGDPELICHVPATAFTPQPKVDSAVIKIQVAKTPKIQGDTKALFRLIHMAFSQKRKKLTNNLAAGLQKSPQEIRETLASLEINPDIRAEDLNLEEWQKLLNEPYSNLHSSQ